MTITGGTLNVTGAFNLCGPTELKTLTVRNGLSAAQNIFANGHSLVVASDVQTTKSGTNYCSLYGGAAEGVSVSSTNVTVNGGTWYDVIAGSRNTTVPSATLTLDGATVVRYCAPGWNGGGENNTVLTAKNSSIAKLFYSGAGTRTASNIYNDGDVTLNIDNTDITALFRASSYTGENGNNSFRGNLTLNIKNNETKRFAVSSLPIKTFGTGKTVTLNVSDSALPAFNLDSAVQLNLTASAGKTLTLNHAVSANSFTVPSAVTLRLFSGVDHTIDDGEIDLGTPTEQNGILTYTVESLPVGVYHYRAAPTTGTQYYSVVTVLDYDGEKMTIGANPGLRAGTGFEPDPASTRVYTKTVHVYAPGSYEKLIRGGEEVAEKEWDITDYEGFFSTPGLKRSASLFAGNEPETGRFQVTTQEEMLAFLDDCAAQGGNMYPYKDAYVMRDTITDTGLAYDMPIVIFSKADLAGKSYTEAVETVKGNGKPIVLYHAQMHSNEPAGSEAALVMIERVVSGSSKQAWLESINLVVIPRVNVLGAYHYSRYNNGVYGYPDTAREFILAGSAESTALLEIFNTLEPVAVIDGHESIAGTDRLNGSMEDVSLSYGKTVNSPVGLVSHHQAMYEAAKAAEEARGIRAKFYGDEFYIDEENPDAGKELGPAKPIVMAFPYYANRGSLAFLIESRGIGCGSIRLDRRVMTHFTAPNEIKQEPLTHWGKRFLF